MTQSELRCGAASNGWALTRSPCAREQRERDAEAERLSGLKIDEIKLDPVDMGTDNEIRLRQERHFAKPPAAIWPFVSDSARIVELSGFAPYRFEERVDVQGQSARRGKPAICHSDRRSLFRQINGA